MSTGYFDKLVQDIGNDLKDLVMAYIRMHSESDLETVMGCLINGMLINIEGLVIALLQYHNSDVERAEKFIDLMFGRSKQSILEKLKGVSE